MTYPDTLLFINGKWRPSGSGQSIAVVNPATEEIIGSVAHAGRADLDEALAAAAQGFKIWRAVSAFDRCKIMRKAAALMRERAESIAPLLTMEQGKTLAEAKMEAMASADMHIIDRLAHCIIMGMPQFIIIAIISALVLN